MKVAVLWTDLSGYVNSCLRELHAAGAELLVVCSKGDPDAPFDAAQFGWIESLVRWGNEKELDTLDQTIEAFAPEVLIFSGWAVPMYRATARRQKGRMLRIMTMDNPWSGSAKQFLGVAVSRFFLRPLADMVWVPGERQARFARALGFAQSQVLYGLYSCDYGSFHDEAGRQGPPREHAFLFVGRFVAEKGLDTIVAAYRMYRQQSSRPWVLHCFGRGPLQHLLAGEPGVDMHGFAQPGALPSIFARLTCFVLPSRKEHWGVVVHEAAAAGLIIISSEAVGSVPHLVRPGLNGFLVEESNVTQLAAAMLRVERLSEEARTRMSSASMLLAAQFTPKIWAQTLLDAAREHINVALPRSSQSDVRKELA